MGEEREIPTTGDYTERIASAVVVATTPEGFFVIDFLRPVVSLIGGERNKIKGYKGEQRPDVRIYTTPLVAKRLLKVLSHQVEEYEKKFGEIRVGEMP